MLPKPTIIKGYCNSNISFVELQMLQIFTLWKKKFTLSTCRHPQDQKNIFLCKKLL